MSRIVYDSNWGKYHNKKIVVDGETFDSAKEYSRWCELKMLERAGEIADLERQKRFELIPTQKIDGKTVERPLSYIADFCYVENGKPVVEDCKGMRTDVYIIKRKLMLFIHGIRVRET